MYKHIFFILLLFASLLCISQSKGNTKMPEVFYNCWIASPEEDSGDNSISETYRPCNYKDSKPSMFRYKIEFFKNGKCKWLQLAANDAHYFIDGVWFYKFGKVIVRNEKKETELKFKIQHLAYNRMNIIIKYKK